VSLETDSVDLDAVGLDQLDNLESTGGLGAGVFDVVVVVVELDRRVCGGSGGKCDGEVGFANGVVPQTGAVSSVLVKSYKILDMDCMKKLDFEIRTFVHNVPCVALSLVVGNDVGDVVLQSRNQRGIGPRTAGNYHNFSKETSPTSILSSYPSWGAGYARQDCGIAASDRWPGPA
jgi:hypothetical protein